MLKWYSVNPYYANVPNWEHFTLCYIPGLLSQNSYKIIYKKYIFLERRGNFLYHIDILARLSLSRPFGNVLKFIFFFISLLNFEKRLATYGLIENPECRKNPRNW